MSILSLLYRTAGAWGAGKGSKLTSAEVDQNFYDLEQAVEEIAANPTAAVVIEDATVTDSDQLSFLLSNGDTVGPVTLPSSKPNWREDWLPETEYFKGDMFRATDPVTLVPGIYYTNRDFESGIGFDPLLGVGIGGTLPYASFMMAYNNKVRVGWFWPGKPGEGIPTDVLASADTAIMFSFLTVDDFYIVDGFPGSISKLRGPSFAPMEFIVQKDNVPIGTLSFTDGDADGVFAFTVSADHVQFIVGESLELAIPTGGVDDTAYGLAVNIVGTLGTFEPESSS